MNIKELEEIFKNEKIKFFYTIPRNHNPLGTYYSVRQRKSIIELAHKYNVYVVEDYYFSDVYSLPNYSPIYYYSDFKNCIYLKSYSKTIPYIRIGAVVIPDNLIDKYEEWIKYSYYTSYYMPSLVSQATFESYIKSNIYEKHIKIIDKHLKELLSIFRLVTVKWDSNIVKVIGGKSGYYSTMILNSKISSKELIDRLKKRNIYTSSNKRAYYNKENYDNSIRISLARLNKNEVKIVLEIIYEEILTLM
ncbi:aminotransferase class I/II-fold pyridoxal phosphate-dependent enzyme [Clostridium butyricum]|uniref:aminotransferase class I/II-fold pyridoxal phosphate-dependent enzyme n=1 Tax=Clostridium butyricum TaxID=1492 RepID=UPI00346693F3